MVSRNDAVDVALAAREATALRRWVRRFRGFKPRHVGAYLAWYVRIDPERDELTLTPVPAWARRTRLIPPWSPAPEGLRLILETLAPDLAATRPPAVGRRLRR
jgi:hypothetical protein